MSTDTKVTKLNNNMLVIGGSGAGKTFYIVKPNIMQMLPKGSFIATDPKGGAKRSIVKSYGTIATNNGIKKIVVNRRTKHTICRMME